MTFYSDIPNYNAGSHGGILDENLNWPAGMTAQQSRDIVSRFYQSVSTGNSKSVFVLRHTPTGASFSCNLKNYKCAANRARGGRCTRDFSAGLPMCWQHSLSTFGVKLSKTSCLTNKTPYTRLKMLGLFACRTDDFRSGDVICPYIGDIMSKQELELRYPGDVLAPYAVTVGEDSGQRLDSACIRGIGAYANTAPSTGRPRPFEREQMKLSGISSHLINTSGHRVRAISNARLVVTVSSTSVRRGVVYGNQPQVWLVATRTIKSGNEIFVPISSYAVPTPDDVFSTSKTNIKRAACNVH